MIVVGQALRNQTGRSEFSVTARLGTSTLLSMNASALGQHPEAVLDTSIEVELNTLDQFCEENGIDRVSCMKINAKGSELNIFKGAERMLSEQRIDMIMFEWPATPHYEDCTLLLNLWKELDRQNYKKCNSFFFRSVRNGQRRFGNAVFISDKFRKNNLPEL